MITENDALREMACPLCRGWLQRTKRPWWFECQPCDIVIRPGDVGQLQRAIVRKTATRAAEAAYDRGGVHRG